MAKLGKHDFMPLRDRLFQVLKLLLGIGGILRFIHFGVSSGFSRLRFRVLIVEAKAINTKVIFVSTGQRLGWSAVFQQ
ncbi:hypothetical protein [Alloacidobacterium sp.]|uniref:hypothetical protein n=1 Tax=Alloacidobacterium sp. TaxID=2951999 RepID=UPI002D76A21D|nr:hypothetical protein [Alloacidobacterium sp.]